MNQLIIGFSSFLLLLSFSISKAQENIHPIDDAQNILYAVDTLFRPAANSSTYQIIRNSELQGLKLMISDLVDEKSIIKDSVIIQRVDTIYLETPQYQKTNSIVLGESNSMNFIWVIMTVLFMLGCLFLMFLNFKNKSQKMDSTERLKTLETEFERHKKSSIDRERKLMRDLIDARETDD